MDWNTFFGSRGRTLATVVGLFVLWALVGPESFEQSTRQATDSVARSVEHVAVAFLTVLLRALEPVLPIIIVFFAFRTIFKGIFGGSGGGK